MKVFVTGATGYMGSRLIPLLVQRGHEVKAQARKGSEARLPGGAIPVLANPLQPDSYTAQVQGSDAFIHLIGVAHPSPAKAKEFREVDLPSVQVAVGLVTISQMLDALVWAVENSPDGVRDPGGAEYSEIGGK